MKTSVKLLLSFAVLFAFCCDNKSTGNKSREVGYRILDYADLMSPGQEDSLFRLIKNLDFEIGSQVAVVTIDSLAGQSIEEFSMRMADSLRLGRPTHNDGLLVTISLLDRKARIEVGTGLENIIRDEIAAQIIQDDMAPRFRESKYGQGIYAGVDRICKLIADNHDLVGSKPVWNDSAFDIDQP